MSKITKTEGGGVGFCGLLFLLFLGLKLGGVIDWAWIWVFAPLWVPLAAALAIILILLIVAGLIALFLDE